MAENTVVYQGTGRRKNAVARVRLVPGTGKVTINKRDAAEYFGRQQLLDGALAPFKVTDTMGTFDVIALCDGGGISGQAGALRLGIARALLNAGDYRARRLAALRSSPSVNRCCTSCIFGARLRGGLFLYRPRIGAPARPVRSGRIWVYDIPHGMSRRASSGRARWLVRKT